MRFWGAGFSNLVCFVYPFRRFGSVGGRFMGCGREGWKEVGRGEEKCISGS